MIDKRFELIDTLFFRTIADGQRSRRRKPGPFRHRNPFKKHSAACSPSAFPGDRPSMLDLGAGDKAELQFRQIELAENECFSRFAVLMETVFSINLEPAWPVMAFVDNAGRCVAGLQHCVLQLCCDGVPVPVAAIRNVAVLPEWRGKGLMHDLMARTLPWCDARAALTLLYAETPALYARHGFASLPQHSFEAEAPEAMGAPTAQTTDGVVEGALIDRLLATRVPASSCCGVVDDGGMAELALRGGTWSLAHDPALEVLIIHEMEGETLVLVDVVAAHVPPAARILGALGAQPRRLRTLFSPDKLAWEGVPMPEDAGLMARGILPPAMRRPFILPPTFEF